MGAAKACRTLTIGLLLVSGLGIALGFTLLENSETWLQVLVAAMALGAPFIAGWASPRLTYAVFPPFIVLACLSVAFVVDGVGSSDVEPVVFTIYLAVIYGGLASIVFAAGWVMRRVVRRIRK